MFNALLQMDFGPLMLQINYPGHEGGLIYNIN